MIRHVVMWSLKDKNTAGEVKTRLLTMPEHIPQIKKIEVKTNIDSSSTTHDIILITFHDTEEELYGYQNHEYHQEIKKFIPQYCTNRACIDFYD
ncbi:MAG: Dabb family protein [Spirochaetes bacterium]|nr:Dabb family protein [Spirochaetota bacterium]